MTTYFSAKAVIPRLVMLVAAFVLGAQAQAALTVTPITWDVVGLDHNRPLTSGPDLFPVGAQACSDAAAAGVDVTMDWGNADTRYINHRAGSLTTLSFPALGAGECVDAYFEIQLTRSADAFGASRPYTITATETGNPTNTASTPAGRQIYIERLVSQNRNSTTQIRYGRAADQSDWVVLGAGGSINLAINKTYFVELTTQTSTAYEQIQSFLTLSNTIFQVLSVSSTYSTLTAPPSRVPDPNPRLWADACLWDSDPGSAAYNSCLSAGKAGGVVTTVYEIRITSGGGDTVGLEALIYDRSGGSFHYNTDFSNSPGDLVTFDPAESLFAKRFVPDTIGPPPATARLRFTITNPNPIALAGYNFLDTLPSGVLVTSPASVTNTCGGTVTAAAGGDQIALANGRISANGSCTVLVDIAATAVGSYDNVSDNLFIGDTDTGNNAAATLTVSATPPPVLVCDDNATLAQWTFDSGGTAASPLPAVDNLDGSTATAGTGLAAVLTGGQWGSNNINTQTSANPALNQYFEFQIDTTGLDEVTLSLNAEKTSQGPTAIQLYYGETPPGTASTIFSPVNTVPTAFGPVTYSSGLNPAGVTTFRLYLYNAGRTNNGHYGYLNDVTFQGLVCSEQPPPDPDPGVTPPTIGKLFAPTPIGVGQVSTLTFTVTNPNATALSGIAFNDELPLGVSLVPGTFGGTCTGFWGAAPGEDTVLVHSGGSLAGNASCILSVDVTTSTVGAALNISEPVYATESGYNTDPATGTAQAELDVLASPGIAKAFAPDLLLLGVTPGDAATLTFTITNPNPDDAIAGVAFSDTFPAGLVVASPAGATTSGCGSPTWAPVAGEGAVSFTDGSIAAGGVCTVTVSVTGPAGVYDNVSSAVSHLVNGDPVSNGNTAAATLVIDQPIPGISILKQVGGSTNPDGGWVTNLVAPPGTSLYYRIIVENTGEVPLSAVTVSDPNVSLAGCAWTDPLPVASAANDNHITSCIVGPISAQVGGPNVNTATASGTYASTIYTDTSSAQYIGDPTAVTMGQVGLNYVNVGDFLQGIGVPDLDAPGLLALLRAWSPASAAALQGAGRPALLAALRAYLDPDGDGQVAVLGWETLEQRGTLGFYVEREAADGWVRINDDLLPAIVAAPMGAEYLLADPAARPGETHRYRLIEIEVQGVTRTYGPYPLRATAGE